MKLWMENLVDAGVVTAATENAEFPATNVQAPRLAKVYKTTGAGTSEAIYFDLGSALEPTDLLIAAHNLTADSGVSNFKLWGGATGPLPSDVSYTLTTAAGTIHFDIDAATPASGVAGAYRYWALTFTKGAALDIKQVGRVYLGPIIEPTDLGWPDYDGVTANILDRSDADESIGGEEYIEAKTQVRNWALDFSEIPEDEMDDIVTRYEVLGKHTPFFLQISTVTPLDELVYVRITNNLGRKVASFDAAFNWDTALNVKEFI